MPSTKQVRPLAEVTAADLRAATDEFAQLIEEKLPLQFDAGEVWPAVAHAFLARAGDLLDSLTMLAEAEKQADAQALLRVFFELVTLFCWIAIAPKAHIARWQEWSSARQLKVHNDAKQFGLEVLTPSRLAEIGKPEQPLGLATMAQEVDEHWPKESPAFRSHPEEGPWNILTFRGAYASLYRKGSTIVHTDQFAVDRYLSSPLTGSVTVHKREKHSSSPDYPGLAVPFMGFLLLTFARHFNWPNDQVVRKITDGLIYRSDGSPKD
jgi:hypothetical protein